MNDNLNLKREHIVDIIIRYFLECDYDSNKFNIIIWDKIYSDLSTLIHVSESNVRLTKDKYKDESFNIKYENFLNFLKNDNSTKNIYLNRAYAEKLVTCNKFEINKIYPDIFSYLWINDMIKFKNENLGVILFNSMEFFKHISLTLKSNKNNKNSYSLFKTFINYMYGMFHSKKIEYTLTNYDWVDDNNIIRNYATYIYFLIKDYFNEHLAYYDTDVFFFLNKEDFQYQHSEILNYLSSNSYPDIKIDYTKNIECVFLNIKKYIYIEDGKMNFVGINRLDSNNTSLILKLNRKAKIKEIFS